MAGEGEDYGSLKHRLFLAGGELLSRAREADLALDPQARTARERIFPVGNALKPYLKDNSPPKVMKIKAEGREYVSFRRFEGTSLEQFMDIRESEEEEENPFETKIVHFYPVEELNEGQLLVLFLPCDYACKSSQRQKEIEGELGDKLRSYGGITWFAMMGERPDLYREDEWTVSNNLIMVATREGNNLFTAIVTPDDTDFLKRSRPDREGNAQIAFDSYFQSETQLEAERKFIRKHGRMYLLEEGSSELARGHEGLKKLEPLVNEVDVRH